MCALQFPLAANHRYWKFRLPARGAARLTSPSNEKCKFHGLHLLSMKRRLYIMRYTLFMSRKYCIPKNMRLVAVHGCLEEAHSEIAPGSISSIMSQTSLSATIEIGKKAGDKSLILSGLKGSFHPGNAPKPKAAPFEERLDPGWPGPIRYEHV